MNIRWKGALHKAGFWLPAIIFMGRLNAQTSLALSAVIVTPTAEGATVELSLNSSSGITPAAIQWTFQYPSAAISSLTIEDGPALTAVGKTVICTGGVSALTCMAVGFNAETIPDGLVAKINAVFQPGENTAVIAIVDAMAVSVVGDPIPIDARGGIVNGRTGSRPVPITQRSGRK